MKLHESEHIWFDGELIPWSEAKVHVLSHVLHYGTSAFEGIRAYSTPAGPAVLGLAQHVKRFFDSCKIVNLPFEFTREEVTRGILETVRGNRHDACYIRPFAFRGYGELGVASTGCPVHVVVATFPWGALHGDGALENGVDVGVSSWRRMAPDTHPAMAKAGGNYVNSMLVVAEARRHGYAEGIVLDVDGYVSEGSGENVFFVKDGALLTPPIGASILPGITRGFVIRLAKDRGIPVLEQKLTREMLYVSDEVFMTGTAAEVTPVRSVDGKPVADGKPGELTRSLQSEFFGIVRGEAPDRHGWLTPVR